MRFDWSILAREDRLLANSILHGLLDHLPDLVIAPDGKPYLYRWYVTPHSDKANVYFHIQVASDPERPLHDHPWDNVSVILSGGYDEIINFNQSSQSEYTRPLRKGDVVFRRAKDAHRLILPPEIPYTMTLFTTGPRVREWGFWFPDGWRSYKDVTEDKDGMSQFKEPTK